MEKLKVIVEYDKGLVGYSAQYIDEIGWAGTTGKTLEKLVSNIIESLTLHFNGSRTVEPADLILEVTYEDNIAS